MKRSELKQIIREEYKKLNEGTWALPKNQHDIQKANQFKKQIEQLKKSIYHLIGDDELFDALDNAIERIDVLISAAINGKDFKK